MIIGDSKPEFLRAFADWVDQWFSSQISNTTKFTLSSQTSQALSSTSRSLAAIIEDLLSEGYEFVLTSRKVDVSKFLINVVLNVFKLILLFILNNISYEVIVN